MPDTKVGGLGNVKLVKVIESKTGNDAAATELEVAIATLGTPATVEYIFAKTLPLAPPAVCAFNKQEVTMPVMVAVKTVARFPGLLGKLPLPEGATAYVVVVWVALR